MPEVLPPGVEKRVKRISEICDPHLQVFVDNLNNAFMHMVLRKEPLPDWQREALKKSLIALIDCSDSALEEFK